MHERDAILHLFQNCEQAALATVVEVKGSAYRRAGARMLLAADGRSAGVINGGCLDADLHARAQIVTETGEPQLAIYDSTSPQDIIFGLGLGCRGVVKILIEPARDLDFLRVASDQKVAVATLFEREIPAESGCQPEMRLGTRMVWRDSPAAGAQRERNDLHRERWASQIESDVCEALQSGSSHCRDYSIDTGSVRIFVELLAPPQSLFIFGAGADVVPLDAMARLLGWNVQVIDLRAPSPSRPVFVESTHIPPEQLAGALAITGGAACVIMTHNFLHDLELLKKLLPSDAAYIGILGPKHRTDELLGKIGGSTVLPGVSATEAQLARLFSPVGLDLGGETPEEIALSIIAEIQKAKRRKSGQSLREKSRIH